jgi:hypothetical protein
MDDMLIAVAIYVVAIELWIGGVAMVAITLLSALRRFKGAEERTAFFETMDVGAAGCVHWRSGEYVRRARGF